MVGVPIDVLNRLLGGVDPHLGRTCEFSSAIDDAGFQNARPELRAVVKARDALEKGIGVIRHVSRACDAIGKVQSAVVVVEMLVTVPHSRHEETTVRIDDFRVCRWLNLGIPPHADDAVARDDDGRSRRDPKIPRIEQSRVANDKLAARNVCQGACNTFRPRGIRFLLRILQLRDRRLGSVRHDRKPGRHGCGCAIAIQPD